jgi:hypothetical protein
MTSNFSNAMATIFRTLNGAISLSTPDMSGNTSGRVSLFFKSVRGLDTPLLYEYLRETSVESVHDAFLLVFHIRDCRGGKGERDIGRRALVWLFLNYPVEFLRVVPLIAEYGRWDDILQLFPSVLDINVIQDIRIKFATNVENEIEMSMLRKIQNSFVSIMTNKIITDRALMESGEPVSLCAKWVPTENGSLDRKTGVYKNICKKMGIKPKYLRTHYLTPLRQYINIVERYMCENRWYEIEYSKVPSSAMRRLKKAFENHSPDAFAKWKMALKSGYANVNAKQLQPHELIREVRTNDSSDSVCEAQWKVLEEEVHKLGALEKAVIVVDTSLSMYMKTNDYLPIDIAMAMGLIISNAVTGSFHNHVITFHSNPTFVVLKKGSLYNRWRQLSSIPWGGTTNIKATFDMVLEQAKNYNLSDDDMPKTMFIVSDMQFNQTSRIDKTNFMVIDEMYKNSGYTRPKIVFWNVAGSSRDFPVSVNDSGTALISGFSPSIMKSILKGTDCSPYTILRDTIDDKRYDPVRKALSSHLI